MPESVSLVRRDKDQAASSIKSIALSADSYLKRLRQCVGFQTGEYVRTDFAYSLLAACLSSFITLIDGSVNATTAFWAVTGFVSVFLGRFVYHILQAPALIDGVVRNELASAERHIAELTKFKTVFEVDEHRSTVSFNGSLQFKITLRFENTDTHSWSMKRLDFTLHAKKGEENTELFTMYSVICHGSNGALIPMAQFEGMLIQGGTLSPFYEVRVFMDIVDEKFKGFEDTAFQYYLRVAMDASNQPIYTADYYLNVDDKNKTATLMSFTRFSSDALRRRIRRLN